MKNPFTLIWVTFLFQYTHMQPHKTKAKLISTTLILKATNTRKA